MSHNVGDVKQCLVLQSIYIIFENIWTIHSDNGNPKEYSNWQLLSYHAHSPNDQPSSNVPASLQRDIPLLVPPKSKAPAQIRQGNITSSDNQLYENTIPGSGQGAALHPSLREDDCG